MLAGSFFEVLGRFIRLASYIAILFIVAGLIGLLTDEVRDTSTVQATRIPDPGSPRQVTQTIDIEAPKPGPDIEQVRQDEHTNAREVIDDVGDVLMGPFTWIIEDSDGAVRKLLYSALALILYGFILQVLADFIRKEADAQRRADRAAQEAAAAEERRKTGTY